MAASDNAPPPGNSNTKLGPFNIGDISTAVSIVGGLTGLVFVVGGFVLAVRLTLYSLPTEAVVVQIPQTALLAVGLTEVVLPALGIVFAFGMYRLILRSGVLWQRDHRAKEPRWLRWMQGLGGWRWVQRAGLPFQLALETLIAASLTYVVFAVSRPKTFTGHEGDLPLFLPTVPLPFLSSYAATVVAAIVAVIVVVLVASTIASMYVYGPAVRLDPLLAWTEVREVWKMVIVVAMLTLVLMTFFAMTLPFLDVKVCRKGAPDLTGWLVATSGDRLYIGQQTLRSGESRYVESVRLSDVNDLFISGEAERTSCPA